MVYCHKGEKFFEKCRYSYHTKAFLRSAKRVCLECLAIVPELDLFLAAIVEFKMPVSQLSFRYPNSESTASPPAIPSRLSLLPLTRAAVSCLTLPNIAWLRPRNMREKTCVIYRSGINQSRNIEQYQFVPLLKFKKRQYKERARGVFLVSFFFIQALKTKKASSSENYYHTSVQW